MFLGNKKCRIYAACGVSQTPNRVIKLERIPYMKSKRILALTGAVILIALYVSSIIFALMDSPLAENLLLASLFCTIVIPAVLYGYAVALRYFKKKK